MIPTKFCELTNQELKDKLSKMTAKSEDGKVCLMEDPSEASDIIQEAMNRLDAFDNVKKLFERPAYAQISVDITPDNEVELNLKVRNGGGAQ